MSDGSFTSVNLSQLPAPSILEAVDFEQLFDEMLTRLQEIDPAFTALLPSDPAYKILEVCAFFRLLDRQRVNDAAKGVMLAYAVGSDLDNIAALFGVVRQVITPADDATGAAAVLEVDAELRRRAQLGLEGYSVAGPVGAYVFHALGADPRVLDASATSPEPGVVAVTVLARDGDGTPPPDLLAAVHARLNADEVRPLTDTVTVGAPAVVSYAVDATIYTHAGPDPAVVLAESRARCDRYVAESRALGRGITLSGVYAALHGEGVRRVDLRSPAGDIDVTGVQTAVCASATILHGGTHE